MGGQSLTSTVVVPAGHPVVPWAKELQEALLSNNGWQNGALAQRFIDIVSVRLCPATVAPYTSKLSKFECGLLSA